MKKGIDMHEHLMIMFDFLNLEGYSMYQKYRYYDELRACRKLYTFYLNTYNKLLPEQSYEKIEVIPSNWTKYEKMNVDSNTKRATVRDMMKLWIKWEQETKVLLEGKYKELEALNDMYAALMIADLLREVGHELEEAYHKFIDLETCNYDMVYILDEQSYLCKFYKKKIYEDDVK